MAYSFAQLEALWLEAGGPASAEAIAASVALAESGGNPDAVSSTGDYGLWQINAEVPQNVTPGFAVPLVITAGGASSNTVTIAVQ